MAKGKVNEAGGGPAVPLANDLTSFFQRGLASGTFTNQPATPGVGTRPRTGAAPGFQQTPADNFGRADPVNSTQGIAGTINQFLGGNLGAQQYNPDTAGLQGLVGQGQYNFDPMNVQGSDFSGFNTDALKNFNPGVNLEGFNAADVGPQWDQLINTLQGQGLQNGPFIQQLSQALSSGQPQTNINLSDPNLSPYIADLDRSRQMGLANERARFGAQGGSSFGTPAAFAESNFLNEEAGKRASTLAGIGQSQQALDLQRQLGQGSLNAQNYGTYLGALGQGAGLQNQGGEAALNALLGRAGMQNSAALQARGQNLESQLGQAQLREQGLSQGLGLDFGALQEAGRQGIDIGNLQNQYQGMRAQNQLASTGLDQATLQAILGAQGQAAGLNEQQRQFDVGSQGNMLNNLLGYMTALGGKGISQREGYYQPSAWETAGNVIGGLAQGAGAIAGGFAQGGIVHGYANGGMVPTDTDTVPAMLTPGEGVLNTGATQMMGPENIQMLNAMGQAQHLFAGGFAGGQLPSFLQRLQPQAPAPNINQAQGFGRALQIPPQAQGGFNPYGGGMQNQGAFGQLPQMGGGGPLAALKNLLASRAQTPQVSMANINPAAGGMQRPMINPAPGGLSGPMIGAAANPTGGLNPFTPRNTGQFAPQTPRQLPQIGAPAQSGMGGFGGGGNRRGLFGFAEGGIVPNPEMSDHMINDGEMKINRRAVEILGPVLHVLNSIQNPMKATKIKRALADASGLAEDEVGVVGGIIR